VRRDVNSYITEKADGKTKEKGAFLKEVDLKKAYHMPIVAKALYGYFIKGIPVRKTLEECRDIMEFCISQKSASNFSIELQSSAGVEKLQKTNRFYITKKGGAMTKKANSKVIGLYVGKLVGMLNTYDPSIPFEDYFIDLAFYEKEVMKIIDEIEPKQMSMFEVSELSQSSVKKMEMPDVELTIKEEKLDVKTLNKLGKNQLAKKLESIARNNQVIEKISPRYVYVLSFDSRDSVAEVYCLAKGIRQSLPVDKKAYKKSRLAKGDLVFCDKFSKVDGVHSIVEYQVTDKIVESNQTLM